MNSLGSLLFNNHLQEICTFLQYFAAFGSICSILQHKELKDNADNSQTHPRQLKQPSLGDFIGLTIENWPFFKTFYIFAVFCSILQHFKWYTMLIFPHNTSDISLWLLRVISMAFLQQINQLQQLCEFLQHFAAFCSILQHFAAFCSSRNEKLLWYFPETFQISQLAFIRWFH